jgi:transposase
MMGWQEHSLRAMHTFVSVTNASRMTHDQFKDTRFIHIMVLITRKYERQTIPDSIHHRVHVKAAFGAWIWHTHACKLDSAAAFSFRLGES